MKEKVEIPQWAMYAAATLVLLILVPLLTMLVWNGFMPHVFGLPTLDYGNAGCLDAMLFPLVVWAAFQIRVD